MARASAQELRFQIQQFQVGGKRDSAFKVVVKSRESPLNQFRRSIFINRAHTGRVVNWNPSARRRFWFSPFSKKESGRWPTYVHTSLNIMAPHNIIALVHLFVISQLFSGIAAFVTMVDCWEFAVYWFPWLLILNRSSPIPRSSSLIVTQETVRHSQLERTVAFYTC